MSSEQKTIVINPELFSTSNKKKIKSGENNTTRKKEKKSKPIIPNTVPNSKTLRKQFIKKIKEKQAESEKQYKLLESQKDITKQQKDTSSNNNISFQDEFTKSLAYLTALSESREKEKLKKKNEQKEQKKMNFTLKRERSTTNNQQIQLELPEALQPKLPEASLNINNINQKPNINIQTTNSNTFSQNSQKSNLPLLPIPISITTTTNPSIPIITTEPYTPQFTNEDININTKPVELKSPPPYGCLKGGNKPTYKQWTQHNRTFKSSNQENNNNYDINKNKEKLNIQDFKKNEDLSEREKRLQALKNKYSIKQKQNNENINNKSKVKKYNYTRTIKKTTTIRNFKLGKNPKRKTISVLIKNGSTRKKIKTEIAELKRKSLNEIKEYLRSRNLLKVGSDAPPDVLRQMYETSILTGEINNLSSETLVHNFLNS